MNKTKIQYLDYSWNPLAMRCTPVSAGCKHCWHLRMANRFAKNPKLPKDLQRAYSCGALPVLVGSRFDDPIKLKKPARIGTQFMGDLFHGSVSSESILAIFGVMAAASQHTYLVLSKRPGRMLDVLGAATAAERIDMYKHIALAGRISEVFMSERIKPIADWPGYFVTTTGRVLSERNHGGNRDATTVHEMRPQAGKAGHSRVELQVNGASNRLLVHRLVLSAFDRAARDGEQCRHIDGDATNNHLWNLKWGSQSENWDDSKRHGTRRRYSKLNSKQVIELRRWFENGESVQVITSDYGISDTQVRNIGQGNQWKPEYIPEWPLCSVWIGVSVENQQTANERIPLLLQIPAAVYWVSVEPFLSAIDLRQYLPYHNAVELCRRNGRWGTCVDCPRDAQRRVYPEQCIHTKRYDHRLECRSWLNQVICGSESGPGARPMDEDWVRDLRDQSMEAGTSFYYKQKLVDGKKISMPELDGRVWDQFPKEVR